MASQPDQDPTHRESESEQLSRLKRYDQRLEEWLASLKDEAEQRSPEVLSALAAKAKDVGAYLDKMAEKARSRSESPATPSDVMPLREDSSAGDAQAEHQYPGPDPAADTHGEKADKDQST